MVGFHVLNVPQSSVDSMCMCIATTEGIARARWIVFYFIFRHDRGSRKQNISHRHDARILPPSHNTRKVVSMQAEEEVFRRRACLIFSSRTSLFNARLKRIERRQTRSKAPKMLSLPIYPCRVLTYLQAFLLLFGSACGELTYLPTPNPVWETSASEALVGNGLFFTPAGDMLVGSFADGSVRFYNPETGADANPPFAPDKIGFSTRGYGGITFSPEGDSPYLVYAVSDDPVDPSSAKT